MRRIGLCELAVALCVTTTSLQAQEVLSLINGSGGDDHLGWANSGVGDVNKDGFPDLIVGAPDYNIDEFGGAGLVRVFSGKDLTVLWQHTGVDDNDRYGQFVSEAGDVNKDGWPDFIISATAAEGPNGEANYGSAEVRSGKDFSILYKWYGDSTYDDFGDSTSPVGDVNADGWIDIVVGGRRHDGNGTSSGIARVFSGFDGTVLYDFYGDGPGWLAGSALSGAGDLNHDGHDDVIVGCRGASPSGINKAGQAVVYSGFNGAVLLRVDGEHATDGLGSGVAGLGDVDKDGTVDVGIGIWQSAEHGPVTGSAMVISGATHAVLYRWIGEHAGAVMGVWLDTAGDANRDGWPDIVVGAEGTNVPGIFGAGKVYVYSGKDGSEVFAVHGDAPGDRLGTVVALAGDVNEDGYTDVISGAYWNDNGGHDAGTARVYSGCANCWDQIGVGLPGVNGVLNLAACSVMEPGDKTTLKLINAAPLSQTLLLIGLSAINAPFKGGIVVPSPDVLLLGGLTNSIGTLALDGSWPNGLPTGTPIYIQFWVPDHFGASGWSSSNGVTAITP